MLVRPSGFIGERAGQRSRATYPIPDVQAGESAPGHHDDLHVPRMAGYWWALFLLRWLVIARSPPLHIRHGWTKRDARLGRGRGHIEGYRVAHPREVGAIL